MSCLASVTPHGFDALCRAIASADSPATRESCLFIAILVLPAHVPVRGPPLFPNTQQAPEVTCVVEETQMRNVTYSRGFWRGLPVLQKRFAGMGQRPTGLDTYNAQQELVYESTILRTLRHENVLAFVAVSKSANDIETYCYAYCPSLSLRQLCSGQPFDPPRVQRLLQQLIDALMYLRNCLVIVMDIDCCDVGLLTADHPVIINLLSIAHVQSKRVGPQASLATVKVPPLAEYRQALAPPERLAAPQKFLTNTAAFYFGHMCWELLSGSPAAPDSYETPDSLCPRLETAWPDSVCIHTTLWAMWCSFISDLPVEGSHARLSASSIVAPSSLRSPPAPLGYACHPFFFVLSI